MAGMKISVDAAMRARDVSVPGPADEAAADVRDAAVAAGQASTSDQLGPGPASPGELGSSPGDTAPSRSPDGPQAGSPRRPAAPAAAAGRRRQRTRWQDG